LCTPLVRVAPSIPPSYVPATQNSDVFCVSNHARHHTIPGHPSSKSFPLSERIPPIIFTAVTQICYPVTVYPEPPPSYGTRRSAAYCPAGFSPSPGWGFFVPPWAAPAGSFHPVACAWSVIFSRLWQLLHPLPGMPLVVHATLWRSLPPILQPGLTNHPVQQVRAGRRPDV